MKTPYIHIHGQESIQDDILIVGNHIALIQLHRAITEAITKGQGKTQNMFCADGEGYTINVKDLGDSDLSEVDLPYTNELAREKYN